MISKRSTIKDVSAEAGVSISVVSYVLNNTPGKTIPERTREKVMKAAESLDYTPNAIARGMRMKKSMTIGLVSFWEVTDTLFIETLSGLSNICSKNGYNILISHAKATNSVDGYLDLMKRQQIDGIVFISPHQGVQGFDEHFHVQEIKKYQIPAVILNGYTSDKDLNFIYMDYHSTTKSAVEYLVSLGHKDIAYLQPDAIEAGYIQTTERLRGFKEALVSKKLRFQESNIFNLDNMLPMIKALKAGLGPTGIVANKSSYAYDLIVALRKEGIEVPKDVSVIAANTEPYAPYIFPPLTTVGFSFKDMGQMAAELIFQNINEKTAPVQIKIGCKINELESCGGNLK